MKDLILEFEPGSLKIYKIMSIIVSALGQDLAVYTYAWADKDNHEGFGPFNNIEDCLKHYTQFKTDQKAGIGLKNNVIPVDFVNRKRHIDKLKKIVG